LFRKKNILQKLSITLQSSNGCKIEEEKNNIIKQLQKIFYGSISILKVAQLKMELIFSEVW